MMIDGEEWVPRDSLQYRAFKTEMEVAKQVLGKVIDPNLPEHVRRFSVAVRLTWDEAFDAAVKQNPNLIEDWQASQHEESNKDYHRRVRQEDEMRPHKVEQEIRAILV